MTAKGVKRIGGVTISDPDRFYEQLAQAASSARDPEAAKGLLYDMAVEAIKEARKVSNGYGSCSTCDVLVVANLDEGRLRLLSAEFYVLKGEYRDEEAFR